MGVRSSGMREILLACMMAAPRWRRIRLAARPGLVPLRARLSARDYTSTAELVGEIMQVTAVQVVALLRPQQVIGVGGFAERRARELFGSGGVTVSGILHPSPASPLANQDWAGSIEAQLVAAGVLLPGITSPGTEKPASVPRR